MLTRHFRLFLVTVIALLSCVSTSYAGSFGVQAAFVHNNTKQSVDQVANNTLRIINNAPTPVRFHVNFSLPSGWEYLGNPEKDVELAGNDSIFLPVRLIVDRNSKGGTSYIVTAWLSSDKGVQFSSQNWYVTIPIHSEWSANIPVKQQYFITGVDSSGFRVRFRNTGNADEQIRISLIPDHRIEVLRQSDGGASLLTFTLSLPVGADTVLTFPVNKRAEAKNVGKKDADLHSAPSKELYTIQVLAKALSGTTSWSGTVQFFKLGNTVKQNQFGRSAIPLVLEANVYDVLSDGTTMSLDAYGSVFPKENTIINYRFQTVFITNFLEQNSFLGNNHYIGYFSNNAIVEIGEVNGWGRSLLTGKGIKASYTYGKNTIGAMYTRGPGFFRNNFAEGMGFYHSFRNKKLVWNNYYSTQKNEKLFSKTDLVNTSMSYKINPHHQILIGGGVSIDSYKRDTLSNTVPGFGYDMTYSGSYNKLTGSLSYSTGTGNYSLAHGTSMISGRVNYNINAKKLIAFTYQNFKQRPEYFFNGVLTSGAFTRSDRYELRYGIQSPTAFAFLKPTYMYEENQTLRTRTKGLGVEYNLRNLQSVRISTSGFFGYAKAIDYDVPDFFMARMSVFARWSKLMLSMRYYYGANQVSEQKRFINDKITPQSVHIVGAYDYWMAGGKLLLTTTTNLMYESYFKKVNFRLRPELNYYTKTGMRLSFYASYMTSKQGANPLLEERPGKEGYEVTSNSELSLGFGVRKQIGIPVPGKKYISTTIVIFKDLNGNRKLDANEEGVTDMLVNIRPMQFSTSNSDTTSMDRTHGEDFITDSKGQIIYENIPAGTYSVKCNSLVSQSEWFDANNGEYLMDKRQTLYIPLTKGVRITGSLLVEQDKYSTSDVKLDIARIRVTAIDSSGKTYSALTDGNGNFMMYVPTGIYTLTVNESALGSNYMLTQNKITIDLSYFSDNFSITFNAVEKKRKMNIKKFNLQGEEQK